MAAPNDMAQPGMSGHATGNESNGTNQNITLRIMKMVNGIPSEDHLYLVLGLHTTIGELKTKIQEALPEHPAPVLQRLIYQGRALLDQHASLRASLRIDPRNPTAAQALHLVVRDDGTTQSSSQAHPQTQAQLHTHSQAQPQSQVQNPPQRQATASPHHHHHHLPNPPATHILPSVSGLQEAAVHAGHNHFHNQMHQMQHQLQHQMQHAAALQRAQLAAMQRLPRPLHQHHQQQQLQQHQLQQQQLHQQHHQQQQQQQFARQVHHSQQQQQNHHQHRTPSNNPYDSPMPNTSASNTNLPDGLPSSISQPDINITRIEESYGPNGDFTRTTITRNSQNTVNSRFQSPDPFNRPTSAPNFSNSPVNDALHNHSLPRQQPLPPFFQVPTIPPPSSSTPTTSNNNNNNHLAPILTPQLGNLSSASTNPSETVVWLLSSPAGPQGLVFAPSHGMFTSTSITQPHNSSSTPTSVQPNPTIRPTPTSTATHSQPHSASGNQQQTPTTTNQPTNSNLQPPAPQPGPRPAANAVQAPQQQPAQNRRIQDQEILQEIFNRVWLLFRIYMFIILLSDSGTWRRFLMLGAAILFCLLPTRNPVTTLFQAARRHFDALIGPPALPERVAPQDATRADRNTRATQQGSGTSRRQNMPTPEEAARRLLDQQQRRSPNPVLSAFQSIEQAVILFVASLVPGLGERHVRAREQARRILEEEEARIRAERERAEEQRNESAESEPKTVSPSTDAQNDGDAEFAGQSSSSASGVNRGEGDVVQRRPTST